MTTTPTQQTRLRHDIVLLNDAAQAKAHQARVDAGDFDPPVDDKPAKGEEKTEEKKA